MRLSPLVLVAAVSFVTCLDGDETKQQPLGGSRASHDALLLAEEPASFRSMQSLNFSSSAPHLFASASTLLQQWSNTIFPSGQTLAAVELPAYTMVYHGRLDAETPPSPEWLALDVEMAYGIMGSTRTSYLLTFQTTRRVKCLYFDGESATLMGQGQLDTQMLHIYGNVSGPVARDDNREGGQGRHPGSGLLDAEYARATGLCDWIQHEKLGGRGWGIEGVVRMNAGFEIIWCDFLSDSLELVSLLNVSTPLDTNSGVYSRRNSEIVAKGGTDIHMGDDSVPVPSSVTESSDDVSKYYPIPSQPTRTDRSAEPTGNMPPPHWRQAQGEPFLDAQSWGWFLSATYHYGSTRNGPSRGEERLTVVGCGLASYYAPFLGGTQVQLREDERVQLNLTREGYWLVEGFSTEEQEAGLQKLGRRRRYHNLSNATANDAEAIRHLTADIVRRALDDDRACSGADWIGMMREIVQRTAGHLKALEAALLGFPVTSGNETAIAEWLHGVRGLSHMYMVPFLVYPAPPSSQVDLDAQWSTSSDTYKATFARCKYHYTRRLVGWDLVTEEEHMRWAVEETREAICGVLLDVGFDMERIALGGHVSGKTKLLNNRAVQWRRTVGELRAWLGWEGEYLACEQTCNWDERCYIPMWPMIPLNWGEHGPRRPGGPGMGPGGGHDRPGDGPGGGKGRHHGGGPGARPVPGPPPFTNHDESDLWQPKCIKASFLKSRGT
ncbi:hypothetical protein BROUX41_000745 [Berkeleyomyces rouxiae]|uniref:uncharacterized protein n=1 Tax=Berkeleyomyces rouxiae TaxID=2035830 RepID=UPI003B7EFD3E